MENIIRKSPIEFGQHPVETTVRAGWQVALSYGETQGPVLIDLSHCQKWDLQDSNLGKYQPFGLSVPQEYNGCAFANNILINRMNRSQCSIWNLGDEDLPEPAELNFTNLQDGLAMIAICGSGALSVMERVSNLDYAKPGLQTPCLIQGPICHIPSQSVLLRREDEDATIIFTFSRGYGQKMAEAILHSAHGLGLNIGGLKDLKLDHNYPQVGA